jgi:hypothetical protein
MDRENGWVRLRRVVFWGAIAWTCLMVVGLFVPPERMPGWWQKAWGTPIVREITGSADEQANPGYGRRIYVGRATDKQKQHSELQFEKPVLRKETALADARVDGRAQYRAQVAALALVGLIMALLCIPWPDRRVAVVTRDERREDPPIDYTILRPDPIPDIPAEPVTESAAVKESLEEPADTEFTPAGHVETIVPDVHVTDQDTGREADLVITLDSPALHYTFTVQGPKVEQATGVKAYLDFAGGELRGAKVDLSVDRVA